MISINARPTYWADGRTKEQYLHRVSSRVRGEEVAGYLGTKFNAKNREEGDICIFLKPRHLTNIKDGDYVDVLDDLEVIPFLKERPKVKVIAMSKVHYDYLKKELKNEIVLIYHHHINFERKRRIKNKDLIGGFIGSPSKEAYDIYNKIREKLKKINIDFTKCFDYKTRGDMIDYYRSVDFLVVWYLNYSDYGCFYRHPTKIINAASFGIPSLAQPILGHQEMEGFYLPIEDTDSLIGQAEKLKNDKFYDQFSDKIFNEAEKYHISKTTEAYKQLK